MRSTQRILSATLACLFVVTSALAMGGGGPLRIGVPETFFHDLTKPLILEATEPFTNVLKETTGLTSDVRTGGDPFTVAKQLSDGKLDLAVFHGFEFAWVRDKHPALRPLLIAAHDGEKQRAFVLVRQDSPAQEFTDLQGKVLSLPRRTKEQPRRLLERLTAEAGGPEKFFKQVQRSNNVESGLDELALKKVDATVVDTQGLEFYKDLKPGVFNRLRILKHSQPFPPSVLVYHPNSLSEATANRLRDGLRTAHRTETGKDLMKRWRITAFEPVPKDYEQGLAAIRATYPAPRK